MNWLNLFGGNIIEQVGTAVDGLVTSDDERLEKRNEMLKAEQAYNLGLKNFEHLEDKETTKRWISDNKNLITRLVRPLGLAYVYILFGAVMFADGNIGGFVINSAYIPILETLLVTYTLAYVGGRTVEKVKKSA